MPLRFHLHLYNLYAVAPTQDESDSSHTCLCMLPNGILNDAVLTCIVLEHAISSSQLTMVRPQMATIIIFKLPVTF